MKFAGKNLQLHWNQQSAERLELDKDFLPALILLTLIENESAEFPSLLIHWSIVLFDTVFISRCFKSPFYSIGSKRVREICPWLLSMIERKVHWNRCNDWRRRSKDERTSCIPMKISSRQMSFNDWLRCLWSRTSMWWGRNSSSSQFDPMEEWVKRNGGKSLPLIFVQGENNSHHFARQMKKRISTISMADEHICSNSEESNPISLNNSISGGVDPLNNSALISKWELISLASTQKIFQSGFVLHWIQGELDKIHEEERGMGKTLDYFVHLTVTLCLSTEESFFDVNFAGDLSPRCSSRETKETCVCV